MRLIDRVISDEVIEAAFEWVCKRRRDYSHNSAVWELRRNWLAFKPVLRKALSAGDYRFSPLREIRTATDVVEVWCSRDALVLKALAIVLSEHLAPVLSSKCHHVKGNGGAQAAVRTARSALAPGCHVMKSDVEGYYASIDHEVLMALAGKYIPDPFVLRLIRQYLERTVCFGENYRDVTRGISLGCPLSPLMGALYLKPLDDAVAETGLFYARFMDDWLIIAPSRWKLRKAVQLVNRVLDTLKLKKHPGKTFIGRASKGFDFWGCRFAANGRVAIADATLRRHHERIGRLYEQGAPSGRVRQYIRRWRGWVGALLRVSRQSSFVPKQCFARSGFKEFCHKTSAACSDAGL